MRVGRPAYIEQYCVMIIIFLQQQGSKTERKISAVVKGICVSPKSVLLLLHCHPLFLHVAI